MLFGWLDALVGDERLLLAARLSLIVFLLVSIQGVLARVFRPGRVGTYRILGAVAAYLMLGLVGTLGFALILQLDPNSLSGLPGGPQRDPRNLEALSYFSFVTLTTLGYGDIQPATLGTRNLAVLLAVTGQIFLAVVIARLVGLQIVGDTREVDKQSPEPKSGDPSGDAQ